MFRLFKNRKKPKIFVALTFVFLVLIAVVPNTASAGVFTCLIGDPGEGISTIASFISPAFAIVKGAFNLFGDNTSQTASCANQVLGFIFYLILQVFSILLSGVGILFNFVFEFTVIDMRANIEGIKIVNVGWSVIRDFANILFIFMLLYLAISTILQLDDHGVKHGLSRLIIGAVLINFSLFFVKVPIDVSNILATQIYNKINTPTANGILQGELGDGSGRIGLGDAFMNIFQFQKVFDGESNLSKNPVSTFVMSALLMFITALIFLAVAIIFIKRFIVLVMLMIFSPLAFAGMAIPNHDVEHQISHDFWSSLVKEAFYAPTFLFLVYLALTTGTALEGAPIKGSEELSAILPVGNIITYAVVMGMLIFALTVSEKIGVKGASGAINAFDGMRGFATGWVGKNTIGRIASTTLNKGNSATWLRDAAAGQVGNNALTKFGYQQFARAAISTTSGLAKNKFGGSESYDEKVHHREEEYKQMLEEHHDDPQKNAQLLMSGAGDSLNKFGTDLKAADILHHHMGAEEHANVKLALEDMKKNGTAEEKQRASKALDRYYTPSTHDGVTHYGRLTQENYNKMVRAEYGELDHYNNQLRSIVTDDHIAPAVKADKLKEFISNAKSEAVVLGALKSLGDEGNKAFETGPAAKELQTALQEGSRNRFGSENYYSNIAKDQILSKSIKASSAAAGYDAKMTVDTYNALTNTSKFSDNDPVATYRNREKGEIARTDNSPEAVAVRNKFVEMLDKVKVKPIQDALTNYRTAGHADHQNINVLIQAYNDHKLGDDRTTHNYFSRDNGKRSQIQSKEVVDKLDEVSRITSRFAEKEK